MKKHLLNLLAVYLLLAGFATNAQTLDSITGSFSPNQISPAGILDAVFDQYGNKYSLDDIKVGNTKANSQGIQKTSALLCTSGYFNLYFETGSGMDGTSTAETDRRNVICQVFSDISAFINSPLSNIGNTNRVNVWVRDISQIVSSPSTSGVLGLATAFYNVPQNNTAGFGGIADNEIWKTIHTGTDSYINVASPLVTAGGVNSSGGTFYHGMMAFNFNNSGINWNTNLSLASSPSSLYDLYSVALHEVTHALGFASLINFNGQSKFGTGYNYYSRYDLFLRNSTSTQHLITNSGACSLYNYQFNSALTTAAIAPGGCITTSGSADNTVCNTAATYVGATTVPLYTPNCFEAPSSLSHFEDQCYPTTGTPYGNNLYFTMSNANGTGAAFTKRHLTPEERLVLCDLGYNTNSTFGSVSNNNNFNYSTAVCPGINVAGINDGISIGGAYLYTGSAGSNITIPGSILGNDNNATTFECLADVYDPLATLSATSGNNTASVFFSSNLVGTHLLRYIPVSSTGQRGNITYIYVYILSANCTPSACNLINNGGFESSTSCGQLGSPNPSIDCWQSYICTPDLFKRGCTAASSYNVPTSLSSPAGDSWSGVGNDNFIDLLSMSGHYNESIQTLLNSPIIQNGSYVVNFRGKLVNHFVALGIPPAGFNAQVTIAGAASLLASPGSIPTTALPAALTQLGMPILVPNDNTWHYYSIPFTYLNATSLNNLIVIHSTNMSTTSTNSSAIYIDDVSLTPASQAIALTLPPTLCINQTISDLSSYLTPASAGGVFTGAGVTLTGGIYSFNAAAAGAGNHTITYSFTNNLGCTISVSSDISVVNSNINITASASPNNVCASGAVTLTGSGATSYNWQPGNIAGNPVTVNPTASTSYVVTGIDVNGCQATANVAITVTPLNISLVATPNPLCIGQSANITPSGASTYVLQQGNIPSTGAPFVVSPTSSTIYNVTGTDASGCTGTAQITVNVQTCNACLGCSNSLSGTITSNPPSGLSYCVNNDIVIQGNVNFNSSEFKFAPGVKVIVDNNAVLSISRSHLYACNNFWQGIVIKDNITGGPGTGRVIITGNSLIEDARIAVDVPNHLTTALPAGQYIVLINGAILNKDSIGVRINQYQPAVSAPYLFSIRNSVFTCRNIPYTVTAPFITSAGSVANVKATASNPGLPLASPYIDEAVYTTVNTWYGMPSFYGVQLINVGQTQNPTASSPNYFQVQIGEAASNLFNVFDRLLICVDAKSSNFTCINNVFQNTFAYGKGSQIGGHAITAYSVENLNNRLQVINGASDGTLNNKFFNCFRAILSSNYYEHNIQYCDVRSTQTNPAPLTYLNRIGKYGFYMTTNRFRKVTVNNNSLYNIESAVVFNANYSALNIPPAISSANAQYSGQIDVNYNTIQPNVGTAPITTQYVSNAIYIANVNSTGALNLVPNTTVNTYNNSISSVYRGIYVSNWVKKDVRTISNCITLKNDPYPGPPLQFGVNHTNNTGSSAYSNLIYNNNITGTGITNSQMKGAYSSMSMNEYMRCNNVMSTYSGIEFNGVPSNPGTLIGNIMQNHTYGFVLNNNAAIGAIGSPSQPADNKWMGTWINPNFKTATLGGSSSQTSHMYVRGASGTITNPDGSGFTFGGASLPNDFYNSTNGSIIPATGPYYLCPSIGACIPPNDGGNGGIMPGVVQQTISSTDIQLMEKIALDQMPYTVNPNESKFIGKNHLYRALRADSTLMATSPVLQNFYASSQTTVRETLASIDDKLSDGNIISSQNDVTALNPQNNIEANYKVFYSSYLNYLNDTLSSTDSTNILSLANGCPTVDGAIVYNARALYNSIYSVVEQFTDNCTSSAQGSRLGNFSGVQKWDADKKPFDAIMYPVPSSGDVNISPIGIIEGNLKVIVLDITGKVVFDKALQITNGLCNFKLNLNTGTYLVKIINSDTNESINKKLIMQK